MQIELNEKTHVALEKAATNAGMSVSAYANLIMEERFALEEKGVAERSAAIDAFLAQRKSSTRRSWRNGRPWREFIHEGHGK